METELGSAFLTAEPSIALAPKLSILYSCYELQLSEAILKYVTEEKQAKTVPQSSAYLLLCKRKPLPLTGLVFIFPNSMYLPVIFLMGPGPAPGRCFMCLPAHRSHNTVSLNRLLQHLIMLIFDINFLMTVQMYMVIQVT